MAGKKAERDRLRREAAVARVAAEDKFAEWWPILQMITVGDASGVAPFLSAESVRYIPPVEMYETNEPPADLFSGACLRAKLPGMDAIAIKIAQMLVHEAVNDATFDLAGRRYSDQYVTPLHLAVMSGLPAVVGILLPHVDPLVQNIHGETAHKFAMLNKEPELARLIDNHLAQMERAELEASTLAAAPTAVTVEEARRRRINPFAK